MQGDPFKTLFVGRLSYDVTEKKLRREFEEYGPIKSVSIVHNIKSGALPLISTSSILADSCNCSSAVTAPVAAAAVHVRCNPRPLCPAPDSPCALWAVVGRLCPCCRLCLHFWRSPLLLLLLPARLSPHACTMRDAQVHRASGAQTPRR